MQLAQASAQELATLEKELSAAYNDIKAQNLNLDLTRGKPSSEQLALSDALDGILDGNYITDSGIDTRNYGGLNGIPEARELGTRMLEVPSSNILAGGNSSLTLMHQAVMTGFLFGFGPATDAWNKLSKPKFICSVPGYDRHFSICERFGIEMITVPMTNNGPDMDRVESLIADDASIVGMWCVPKYSNPTGVVYSDETVQRIAALGKIASPSFRVFWDNAYAVHDLALPAPKLANIYQACEKLETLDSILQFASTSKITCAGAGISFMASSEANLAAFQKTLSFLTIGPDKINQLRHAKFFAGSNSLETHMRKHADIVKPRFEVVLAQLEHAFADNELGRWESAEGGYFISFDTRPGLAKEVVSLAANAGVKLTPAGATFPYGKDPNDSNIRIAPTVPSVADVEAAMEVFVVCVKLASVRQAIK